MDATSAIQIAVARADLLLCRARASPWGMIAAGVIVGGLLCIIIKRGANQR